jgi:ribonuclease VapC
VIVDSSALIAALKHEEAAQKIVDALQKSERSKISAATWLEASIVVESYRDTTLSRRFEQLIRDSNITIVPFTEQQALIARAAYRDYGKGSGHSARLNFGDCFAYALAKDTNDTLLFIGGDFNQTDVKSAL